MFDNADHFARFMGISTRTARRWQANRTSVPSVARRLMEVLVLLEQESPALLAVLVGQASKPAVKEAPAPKPVAPSGPFGGWEERPVTPEVAALLRQPITVIQGINHQAAWDAGEYDHLTQDLDDEAYEAFKQSRGIK